MKTFIILLKDRKFAEFIENDIYEIFIPVVYDNAVYLPYIKSRLIEMSVEYKFNIPHNDIEVYPISDFIDMVNNDEFLANEYFISYVYVK
jgi:hypothetical protein